MKRILNNIFFGPIENGNRKVDPAIHKQWKNVTLIWNNSRESTFGIERLFRLFLALSSYIFPGIYIRHISGKKGVISRKIWLEIYVIFKVILPLTLLLFGLDKYVFVQVLAFYLGVETLLYGLGLLFLSDIYRAPISNKRSYLMTVLNYMELCFDFAILYKGMNLIENVDSAIDAVYFSFITSTTIGFGEMTPNDSLGQFIVIAQSLCTFLLVTLVISRVVTAFNEKNSTLDKNQPRTKQSK